MAHQTGKIAVVTVHGTGDTALGPAGEKWFQVGSSFSARLVQFLSARGIEADIVPLLWSGANSALHRERAADSLAVAIKALKQRYNDVHLIGHSHGGNVANAAARILRRRARNAKHAVASLTTVGAPFFRSGLSTANTIGWWALLGILAASTLLLMLLALVTLAPHLLAWTAQPNRGAIFDLSVWAADLRISLMPVTVTLPVNPTAFVVANFVALVLVIPPVVQGARRMLRVHARRHGSARMLCIWHPSDEAIGFLQKLETLSIEAFPRGALWRGARMTALVGGVRVTLLLLLASLALVALATADMRRPDREDLLWTGALLAVYVVAAAPVLFSVVYVVVRLVAGALPEWFGRGALNAWVGSLFRGMAFGRDGDERLGDVAVRPHEREADEIKLSGEVADRMQANALNAGAALIEKYRWALFTVGGDTSPPIAAMAVDAMTWRSLVHTTYFDQPEMADMIGGYIAAQPRT